MNARRDDQPLDIDRVSEEIRQDTLDEATVSASADRVWRRLAERWGLDPGAAAHRPLRNRQDYEGLIDDYVAGKLSPGREALVEEYARENPDFRRQLERARRGETAAEPAPGSSPTRVPRSSRSFRRWSLSAAAVAAAAVVCLLLVAVYGPWSAPEGLPRLIRSEGPAYLVTAEGPRLLGVGEAVPEDAELRTSRAGGAFIELPDGSLIELGDRTELSIDRGRRDTRVDLDRGRVIVEAAKQRRGELLLATADSVVSVTGTVFSVNSGRKGSRVSVIEGEVRVDHNGRTDVLRPGQQISTDPRLERVPLEEEIAWSRNVDDHLSLVNELIDVGRRVEAELDPRKPRHASPLLELVPDDAVLYAAIPNVSRNLEDAYQTFLRGVSASPVLSEWWSESVVQHGGDEQLEKIVAEIDELGSYLRDEVVATLTLPDAQPPAEGSPHGAVVMARTGDAEGLKGYLNSRLEQARSKGVEIPIQLVPTPAAALPQDADAGFFVWIEDGLVAGSGNIETLRELARLRVAAEAETREIPETPFRKRIQRAYREGVEWLMALDVARMTDFVGREASAADPDRQPVSESPALRLLGLERAETVITERKSTATGTTHRAAISFSGPRTGLASALSEPAPIGAVELLSPETTAAAAAALREPADLAEELLGLFEELFPGFAERRAELEESQGLRIVEDLAAPLGGDVAVALDGPMLPVPAWKLVAEVYDPPRLQHTIETIVQQVDVALSTNLEQDVRIQIQPTTVRSRQAWTIGRADGTPVVAYTFVDGYLLATPGPGHLERALRYHDAGARLVDTPRFDDLLPEDGHVHVSGLVFQDLGERLGALFDAAADAAETSEKHSQLIEELKSKLSATLLVAYATEDEITVTTTSPKEKTGMDVAGALGMLGQVRRGSLADLLRSGSGPGALEVR
jgi:ferric-dicitrate binding protein FerR (iron transport regulator)